MLCSGCAVACESVNCRHRWDMALPPLNATAVANLGYFVNCFRYDDNGDALNNVVVIARKSDKSSIDGYGAPDEFLNQDQQPLRHPGLQGCVVKKSNLYRAQFVYRLLGVRCSCVTSQRRRWPDFSCVSERQYHLQVRLSPREASCPTRCPRPSLLDAQKATDKNGKTYYKYELLTRSGAVAKHDCDKV